MDDNGLFPKPSSHDPPVYRPTITETFGLHHFPQGVYELQHDWCTVIIRNDNAPLVQGFFSPETGQPWTLTLLLINIYLKQSVYNPYISVFQTVLTCVSTVRYCHAKMKLCAFFIQTIYTSRMRAGNPMDRPSECSTQSWLHSLRRCFHHRASVLCVLTPVSHSV